MSRTFGGYSKLPLRLEWEFFFRFPNCLSAWKFCTGHSYGQPHDVHINRLWTISVPFHCSECVPRKLLSIALLWTSTGDRESIETWKSFSATFLAITRIVTISRVTARILFRRAHRTGEPSRRSLHTFQWWAARDTSRLRCKLYVSSTSAAVCDIRRHKREVSGEALENVVRCC